MTSRRFVPALIAILLACGLPAAASDVVNVTDQSSPVTVTDASTTQPRNGYGIAVGPPEICVDFRNTDRRVARHVRFEFVYIGSGGLTLGTDPLEREGSFASGVDVKKKVNVTGQILVGPLAGVDGPNCRFFHAPTGTREIDVVVSRVEFADGAAWIAPAVGRRAVPRDDATDSPVR